MFAQKSVLARLLANENIKVQQGNYETAYFDVQTRELGLPLWKDMGKDLYDLLVGHEVSHALFTPKNFFKYMSEGIPHSWLNIVEDIRIEKLILRKYPGLVGNFKRGYRQMHEDLNLFGVKDKDLMKMGFMDRLNLKAKLRDLIDVPFAADEMPYFDKAMGVETYDDVVRVCREIQAWLKEKQERGESDGEEQGEGEGQDQSKTITVGILTDDKPSQDAEVSTETPDIIIDMREDKSSDDEGDEDSDKSDGEAQVNGKPKEDDGDSKEGENEPGEPESGLCDAEALTDVNFQEGQKSLVESSSTLYVEGLTKKEADASVVPYAKIAKARREKAASLKNQSHYWGHRFSPEFPEDEYQAFLAETKGVVNLMVKEFEMRKAAYRTARARTSVRGSLDVNKLHKYRYDDQLFKQVSTLADAKNHGMMMLLDYSGSMNNMLPAVIRQTIALLMFCKRVGIPFEVYAFTSLGSSSNWAETTKAKKAARPRVTHVNSSDMALLELFDSSMSKSDYTEALKMFFWQSVVSQVRSDFENLGNTPLNSALMAMTYKIDQFRQKHKVQKMVFVSLTDGDSNSLSAQRGNDNPSTYRGTSKYVVNVNGKKIEVKGGYGSEGRNTTAKLVKAIENMGVKTVNYFVCSSAYDFSGEIARSVGSDKISSSRSEMNRNGCLVLDDNCGYMRRFILMSSTNEMQGKVEDLEVDYGMTTKQLAKAFNKANGSKKKSRVVTQKFAELVA
jgi:hypothetical protein